MNSAINDYGTLCPWFKKQVDTYRFSSSVNVIATLIKETQRRLQLIVHPDKQPTGTVDYTQRQILGN
eukprot:200457-Heterocapsa_arctica.AAC.1